jgi:hypothetical protein
MLILSLHTVSLSFTVADIGAFFGCLLTGMALHYKKIVKNEYFGYPEEWFPSVSATIGSLHNIRMLTIRRLVSRTKPLPGINSDLFWT